MRFYILKESSATFMRDRQDAPKGHTKCIGNLSQASHRHQAWSTDAAIPSTSTFLSKSPSRTPPLMTSWSVLVIGFCHVPVWEHQRYDAANSRGIKVVHELRRIQAVGELEYLFPTLRCQSTVKVYDLKAIPGSGVGLARTLKGKPPPSMNIGENNRTPHGCWGKPSILNSTDSSLLALNVFR